MYISFARLKNFGIIKSFERNFPKGITLFSGENGQGKTTLVDAMDLNIFDQTKKKLEDWENWEAEGLGFENEFHFEHRGVAYQSKLLYQGGKTVRELRIEGQATPITGVREVVSYLATVLDPKMDRPSMFSFQETPELIRVLPSERREQLRKLFDVNFNVEVADLKEQEVVLEKRLSDLQVELTVQNSKSFDLVAPPELPFTKEIFLQKEKEKSTVDRLIEKTQEELAGLQVKRKALEDAERAHLGSKTSYDVALQGLTTLTQAPAIPELEADPEYIRLSAQTQIEKSEDTFRIDIDRLTADLAKYPMKRPPTFDEALHQSLLNAETTGRVRIPMTEENLRKARLELTTAESGKCITCGGPLAPGNLEAVRSAVKTLEDALAGYRLEADTNKVNADDSRAKKAVFEAEAKASADAREARAKIQGLITELEGKIARLADQKKNALEQIETLKANRISTNQARLNQLAVQRELVDARLKARDEAQARLEDLRSNPIPDESVLRQDLSSYTGLASTLSTDLATFRTTEAQIASVLETNARLEKQKVVRDAKVVELHAKSQEVSSEHAVVKEAREAFQKAFPSFVVLYLVKEIEYHANTFLQEAYKGRYALTFVEKGDALNILYGPRQKDVKSNSSGYESQVFSLAFKIGCARMMDLGFLLLDEPDSSASEDSSVEFYRVLGEAKAYFPQLFTVTHRKRAKTFLQIEHGAEVITFDMGVAS